jgi:DNA-directed RNA polymerase subunit M/transcription elongation factor TFIIS
VFERQHRLQVESYHVRPEELDPEARAEFIRWNVLALEDELHEALGEVGWKPWATSRHLNREAYKKELVDALHFFTNLCLAAGITADELVNDYFKKAEVNAQRQVDGYDGVTTKCPGCRRELDRIGSLKHNLTVQGGTTYVTCVACDYRFREEELEVLWRTGIPAPVGP